MSREVVVVSAVRTAIGTFGGALKDVPPTELGARVVLSTVVDLGLLISGFFTGGATWVGLGLEAAGTTLALAQLDAQHAQLHQAGAVFGRQRQGLFVPGRGLSQTAGRLGGLGLLQGRQGRRRFRRVGR